MRVRGGVTNLVCWVAAVTSRAMLHHKMVEECGVPEDSDVGVLLGRLYCVRRFSYGRHMLSSLPASVSNSSVTTLHRLQDLLSS